VASPFITISVIVKFLPSKLILHAVDAVFPTYCGDIEASPVQLISLPRAK